VALRWSQVDTAYRRIRIRVSGVLGRDGWRDRQEQARRGDPRQPHRAKVAAIKCFRAVLTSKRAGDSAGTRAAPGQGMFQSHPGCLRILSIAGLLTVVVAEAGFGGGTAWAVAGATRRHRAVTPPAKDLKASFQSFCEEWMEKVWARDGQNPTTWKNDGDGVVGRYVAYSRDYNCTFTEEQPPVGKISYRETWYEKRGKTAADAEASTPEPIKIFETVEYFSYGHGRWLY
jgi:hypothetical protein